MVIDNDTTQKTFIAERIVTGIHGNLARRIFTETDRMDVTFERERQTDGSLLTTGVKVDASTQASVRIVDIIA